MFKELDGMATAAATAEYRANLSPDFTLAGAHDAAYLDVEAAEVEVESVDLMGVAERRALNARMAEWYGIG
jgi:hypothetical protein